MRNEFPNKSHRTARRTRAGRYLWGLEQISASYSRHKAAALARCSKVLLVAASVCYPLPDIAKLSAPPCCYAWARWSFNFGCGPTTEAKLGRSTRYQSVKTWLWTGRRGRLLARSASFLYPEQTANASTGRHSLRARPSSKVKLQAAITCKARRREDSLTTLPSTGA